MESASLNDIKKELQLLSAKELLDLCLALARSKKDNKELLGYLLFRAHDKDSFLLDVKAEIDAHFTELHPHTNLYHAKKSLRKLLRVIGKYSKYINSNALAADLYIYFCSKLKNSGIPFRKSQMLVNMYEQQLKKINSLVGALHEDLQSDYAKDLEAIKI